MTCDETPTDTVTEQAAKIMHDAYEAAAVQEGWETQQRSRVAWEDVPEANKRTMYAALRALADAGLLADPADRYARFTEAVAKVTPCTCSAQRSRAERAEAEVARLRDGAAELAADWRREKEIQYRVAASDLDELLAEAWDEGAEAAYEWQIGVTGKPDNPWREGRP